MASASDSGEVTSEHQQEERELDLEFPLITQSSIYSLTLEEIQNTVCEAGKSFGSMNMDEFLTNIWNVEEGQIAGAAAAEAQNQLPKGGGGPPVAPLQRQGSITIPAPLCRKTVDEVWTEIHRGQNARRHSVGRSQQQHEKNGAAHCQPALGEMTLEDFLVKAGVVRETYHAGSAAAATRYGLPAGYQLVGLEGAPVFGQVVGVQGYVDHKVASNGMYEVVGDGGPGYTVDNGYGERLRSRPMGCTRSSAMEGPGIRWTMGTGKDLGTAAEVRRRWEARRRARCRRRGWAEGRRTSQGRRREAEEGRGHWTGRWRRWWSGGRGG